MKFFITVMIVMVSLAFPRGYMYADSVAGEVSLVHRVPLRGEDTFRFFEKEKRNIIFQSEKKYDFSFSDALRLPNVEPFDLQSLLEERDRMSEVLCSV